MGLALDEPDAQDEVTDIGDLKFVVSKQASPYVFSRGDVRIDHYRYSTSEGFIVKNTRGSSCC